MERELGAKKELVEDVRQIAKAIEKEMFKGWVLHPTARRNIEKELRVFLRKIKVKYEIPYEKLDAMFSVLKESIAEYGKNDKDS